MKALGILVLGVVLGLFGAGLAVKHSPHVQAVLGVHANHPVNMVCDCKNCDCKDCKCENCTCEACPSKKKKCCPGH
jgi:hypothetical protein